MRAARFLFRASVLATLLASCGGEVHFRASESSPPPPPPPPETHRITEHFVAKRPNGKLFIAFVLYSSKTMREPLDRLAQEMGSFLDIFWKHAQSYSDIRFAVMLDTQGASHRDFTPAQDGTPRSEWPDASRRFFSAGLQWATDLLDKDGGGSSSPFDSFDQLIRMPVIADWPRAEPTWVNFVYLRNHDFLGDLSEEGLFAKAVRSFKSDLRLAPLSPFRYATFPITFQNETSACHPSSAKLGRNLKRLFSSHPGKGYELCNLDASELEDLAAEISARSQRWILAHVPRRETLEIGVNGVFFPREKFDLDEARNELLPRASLAAKIVEGDEIEVRYDTND